MKKLLLSLIATVFAIGMNAQTEVLFDFDNNATDLFGIMGRSTNDSHDGDILEAVTATLDGVSVTVSAAAEGVTNANRLWATSPVLRMYSGAMTISAPGHKITKIAFSTGSNFNIESVSAGELDGKTWTGENVESVAFNIKKNTQIKTMTVTLDGSGEPETPVVIDGTGEGTVESPYDVTRALSLIANDKTSTEAVYVKGTITTITDFSVNYGNATYKISADGNTGDELTIYRGKNLGNVNFTDEAELEDGDEVVVYGKLIDYNGTPEMASGNYLYSRNGQTYEEPETPAYEAVGDGSEANPYTVADIRGLNIQENDGNKYWVKGFILGCATSATSLAEGDKIGDTNIALGEAAGAETFIPVALPAGDMRTALGVATNPQNIGLEVMVYGTLEKYFSTAGVKNVSDYQILGSVPGGNEGALYSIDFTKASMDEFNNEEEDSWETVVYAVDWTNDAYEESDAEVIKLNSNGLVFDAQGGDYWAMVFSVAFDLSEYTGVYAEWDETLNGFYDADYALHFIGTSLQYFLTEDDEYTTSLEYEGNRAANDGTVFTCHFDIPDDFNGLREYVYFSFDFFAYSSSAEYMGQWTVKNFALYGDNGDGIERIEPIKPADMKIFDLMGRQQNKLQKGLNIMNGKKIVVK